MDAVAWGYVTPYLLGLLVMVVTAALTRYGLWIVAMLITGSAAGLSAYVFAQIDGQTLAPMRLGLAIMGSVLSFATIGAAVGMVVGFLLRRFRQR
jgi:hypothetical protein